MGMNLYKISQTEKEDYDTYDAAIVAASTEEVARNVHPFVGGWESSVGTWASSPCNVVVEFIGATTNDYYDGEIILSSFNAG
jgi:hypothetical protein